MLAGRDGDAAQRALDGGRSDGRGGQRFGQRAQLERNGEVIATQRRSDQQFVAEGAVPGLDARQAGPPLAGHEQRRCTLHLPDRGERPGHEQAGSDRDVVGAAVGGIEHTARQPLDLASV